MHKMLTRVRKPLLNYVLSCLHGRRRHRRRRHHHHHHHHVPEELGVFPVP